MKKAILIVSFGTSHRDAREHSLDCIVRIFRLWQKM